MTAPNKVQIYDLQTDLEALKKPMSKVMKSRLNAWEPIFTPKAFFEGQKDIKLEDYALKDRQLRRIGT